MSRGREAREKENKTVLDAIAQTDVNNWNAAQANVIEKITVPKPFGSVKAKGDVH